MKVVGSACLPAPHRTSSAVRALKWHDDVRWQTPTPHHGEVTLHAGGVRPKKVKRVGHGFRNFANYRLRLLLHCGVAWQTHQTASLRGRAPRLVA
jgi:hypothetical protein